MHDGRLLALEDTIEFFNLVLGTKLTEEENAAGRASSAHSARFSNTLRPETALPSPRDKPTGC